MGLFPSTGILATLSNGFWAAAEWIGWKREKQALENSPEMKARAAGQTDQEIKDGKIGRASCRERV